MGVAWIQANEMCGKWAADLDDGKVIISDRKRTFRECRKHWLSCCEAERAVVPGTPKARKIEITMAGHHLDPYLLTDVDTPTINMMTAVMRRGESPSSRPLCGAYARRVIGTVSLMMDHARWIGAIPCNSVVDAFVPKDDTPEKRSVTMRDKSVISRFSGTWTDAAGKSRRLL